MQGQVLLSVNGRPDIAVNPYDYNPGICSSTGWKSFQLPLDPAWLVEGNNTFTWTIGPRPTAPMNGSGMASPSWGWKSSSIWLTNHKTDCLFTYFSGILAPDEQFIGC